MYQSDIDAIIRAKRDQLAATKNLRTHDGWPLRSSDILAIFGLPPNSPIPPNYIHAGLYIGNVQVFIVTQTEARLGIARCGRSKLHRRVIAHCPICDEVVCAGHLHQHLKGCHK